MKIGPFAHKEFAETQLRINRRLVICTFPDPYTGGRCELWRDRLPLMSDRVECLLRNYSIPEPEAFRAACQQGHIPEVKSA